MEQEQQNTEILLFTKLTYGKYNVIKCPNVCYKIGSEIGCYKMQIRVKKHLQKWNMTLVNKKSTKNVTKYLFSRKIKFKTCFGHILCSLSVTDDHRPPKVLHAKRLNSRPPDESPYFGKRLFRALDFIISSFLTIFS